jgi:gas vesicle protein GvpO
MPISVPEIAVRATEQLSQLTGLKAGTVSGVAHDEQGWHVIADLIELKRIPESSDVLGMYEILLDDMGNLLSYQRTRRYCRGQIAEQV